MWNTKSVMSHLEQKIKIFLEIQRELNDYLELAGNLYRTGPSHDFSHIERVYKLALKIGIDEGANLRVIGIAALFHDLAREQEVQSGGAICHAAAGAVLARRILIERKEDPFVIDAICDCIATHRFRAENSPESIEAKCLYDADKLDSLGAVGIARAYLWLGEHGGTVYVNREQWEKTDFGSNRPEDDSLQREWHLKFRYLPEKLFTSSARLIALKRSETMKCFMAILEREVNGEE